MLVRSVLLRSHVEEDSFRMPGGGNNGVEVPLVPTHIDTDTAKSRAHLPEPLHNPVVGQRQAFDVVTAVDAQVPDFHPVVLGTQGDVTSAVLPSRPQ